MDLRELQREREALGTTDRPGTSDGCERNPDEVFASGEREISAVLGMLQNSGVRVNAGIALDFGCGVGRLTQALGRRFQSVYGVDPAPSIIDQAKLLNRSERCHYMLNNRDDLQIFPPDFFDFIYTGTVLQHMRPRFSAKFIGEFLRILRQGGVLVFDLPDRMKPRREAVRMDRAAYNAQIRILSAPKEVRAGDRFEVRATVHNAGPVPWPGKQRVAEGNLIRLGNHWLKATGESEMRDDGRADLPHDLDAGAEVELTLKVRAPMQPGLFILELDLVHEYLVWFSDAGSGTARQHILAVPAPAAESRPPEWQRDFGTGLHGVPRAELERAINAGRGRVVQVSESISSDPVWITCQYVVAK